MCSPGSSCPCTSSNDRNDRLLDQRPCGTREKNKSISLDWIIQTNVPTGRTEGAKKKKREKKKQKKKNRLLKQKAQRPQNYQHLIRVIPDELIQIGRNKTEKVNLQWQDHELIALLFGSEITLLPDAEHV